MGYRFGSSLNCCFALTALGNARVCQQKHLLEIRNNFWNGRSGNQTRHVRARMLTDLLIANSFSAKAKQLFENETVEERAGNET